MKDDILEELWRVKDQIATETQGSTHVLFDRLCAVSIGPSHRMVNLTTLRSQRLRDTAVAESEGPGYGSRTP